MGFTEAAYEFFDKFGELWRDQQKFSEATFGADAARGPVGALRHLAREANEAADQLLADGHAPGTKASAAALVEFADCLLLLLDATRRAGFKIGHVLDAAVAKQRANERKQWPAPTDPHAPVEHRPAPFTRESLLACVGQRVLCQIGRAQTANIVEGANRDAHEGKEWLPYYKAALAGAWDAFAVGTIALRELATSTPPDSDDFAGWLSEMRHLMLASALLAGNGPAPTAEHRAKIEALGAQFERDFDAQFPAHLRDRS